MDMETKFKEYIFEHMTKDGIYSLDNLLDCLDLRKITTKFLLRDIMYDLVDDEQYPIENSYFGNKEVFYRID